MINRNKQTIAAQVLRSLIAGTLVTVLAACRKPENEPERPSDPTDYFYRFEQASRQSKPPIRWNEREPGRLFVTTLRPSEMKGEFPTPYLTRITRNDQAWSKRIYDVVYGGFDLSNLSPLPPEKGTRWRSDLKRNEIVWEIGGWSRSGATNPQMLVKIYGGRIERRGDLRMVVTDKGRSWHYFTAPDASDLDGRAVSVECWQRVGCSARLTIPQEMAGLPPLREGAMAGSTIGAKLEIFFHVDNIHNWPEIRRKAVCFAAFSIPKLNTTKIAPVSHLNCHDVRAAIKRTLWHG